MHSSGDDRGGRSPCGGGAASHFAILTVGFRWWRGWTEMEAFVGKCQCCQDGLVPMEHWGAVGSGGKDGESSPCSNNFLLVFFLFGDLVWCRVVFIVVLANICYLEILNASFGYYWRTLPISNVYGFHSFTTRSAALFGLSIVPSLDLLCFLRLNSM